MEYDIAPRRSIAASEHWQKEEALPSSAERGRFHGARSSVAESARSSVLLLLGTSHMIGEIVMEAEAVCLSTRLRGHLSAVGAVEDVVGSSLCMYGCSDGRGEVLLV